ncbi:hypothetical protein [Tepidibacter thalassicus]|uniref:Uncharacterized protein n=1 Tax=Tepidibacter thalassicus DSM 15285 TaxID=1123350 RepID=A0A1M5SUK7_9FIRM|nr:hypothetical protein [Tepidibacter thalassicus]SHH42167.1 hypothetical protein SAMN02744040_01916 [Tepidibacter thalassicus DSM 15285]
MNYSYKFLLKDLSIGREIEFKYNNNVYGLLNSSQGWVFVCNNTKESSYYDDVYEFIELLDKTLIQGKTIKQIFDNNEINDSDLTIY